MMGMDPGWAGMGMDPGMMQMGPWMGMDPGPGHGWILVQWA